MSLRERFVLWEETIEAGEAFYLPAGHIPAAEAGTEFVQFSPATDLADVMSALQGDAGEG